MVRSIARLAAGLAVCCGTSLATYAQDMPKRKPGLWEMSMELPSRPGQAMKSQHCVDEHSDAQAQKRAMDDQPDSRCQITRRAAGGMELDYTCNNARGKTEGTMKITGDMQTRYAMNNHMRFDPPRRGLSEANMKMNGEWKGACPADMKPGEIRMTGMPEGRARRADRGASGPRTMTPEQMQQMREMMEQMKKQRGG